MARYVDADKLSEQITTEYCGKCDIYNGELCCSCPMNDALRYIEDFPTADVAPRAEVEELIYKLECLLCNATGGRLSKYTYDLLTMEKVVTDYLDETYREGKEEGYKNARAEVANKICCEIEEEIVAALESNYRALKEWDDGRCNDYILEMVNRIKGKIDALRGIEGFVEELKNEYKNATDTNVGHK